MRDPIHIRPRADIVRDTSTVRFADLPKSERARFRLRSTADLVRDGSMVRLADLSERDGATFRPVKITDFAPSRIYE